MPQAKPMRPTRIILLLILWLAVFLPAGGHAEEERIRAYDSRIEIFADGNVVVTETIRVAAAGRKIRRGIYRDFPTRYRTPRGGRMTVRFDVLEVRRDGRPEPYHTERLADGVRVYMGHENVHLRPGEYTYTLVYRTDRQIGFFADYDELYWNVTGNGWAFAIETARAMVRLPGGAEAVQFDAYTGPTGADGRDFRAQRVDEGVVFTTTRALAPGEGLTVAVAWPKGVVREPDRAETFGYLMADHRGLLIALGGLTVLLAYYLAAWWRVGRDPRAGAVFPRYVPPDDISPAGMRHVRKMGFDRKCLAVAVVSMAVKGFLTIDEADDGDYSLTLSGRNAGRLSPGEAKVARHLFPPGSRTIALKKSAHRRIGAALKALRTSLSGEFEKAYFLRNTGYFLPGIAVSLAALAGILLSARETPLALFMLVWLSGWSAGVYHLANQVVAAWRSRQVAGAMAISLFALPFFGGEVVGIGLLATAIAPAGLALFLTLIAVNLLFYHLLKAPTLAGRRMMDEIEGLKLYMQVAEQERLNLLNPPDRTPAHFEALLPYAMALDVENAWNAQFAGLLAQAAVDPDTGGPRRPAWYNGRTPFAGLAGSLGGAFAGAVSAAASAPGSSSGSSGGGSSGGGGGGGGGGGW